MLLSRKYQTPGKKRPLRPSPSFETWIASSFSAQHFPLTNSKNRKICARHNLSHSQLLGTSSNDSPIDRVSNMRLVCAFRGFLCYSSLISAIIWDVSYALALRQCGPSVHTFCGDKCRIKNRIKVEASFFCLGAKPVKALMDGLIAAQPIILLIRRNVDITTPRTYFDGVNDFQNTIDGELYFWGEVQTFCS